MTALHWEPGHIVGDEELEAIAAAGAHIQAAEAATEITGPRISRPRRAAIHPRDGVLLALAVVLSGIFSLIGLGAVIAYGQFIPK